jgi:hypothetical protein
MSSYNTVQQVYAYYQIITQHSLRSALTQFGPVNWKKFTAYPIFYLIKYYYTELQFKGSRNIGRTSRDGAEIWDRLDHWT